MLSNKLVSLAKPLIGIKNMVLKVWVVIECHRSYAFYIRS
jgi:hypothetical protein